MSHVHHLTILLFLLPVLVTCSLHGARVKLKYVDSTTDFSKSELIRRATHHSLQRVSKLVSLVPSNNFSVACHASTASYVMDISIGTPPVLLSAILDTGSDLIWTQCNPCTACFAQPNPIFTPPNSTTFSKIPCSASLCKSLTKSTCNSECDYEYSYGDGSSTKGFMGYETFSFGADNSVKFPGIGFGCGTNNIGATDNSSGIVGMGRGALSLVSQLNVSKFSYCFNSIHNKGSSILLLGSWANMTSNISKSTPFMPNPHGSPMSSFYYLSLEGITVGETLLPIPPSVFQLTAEGSGGLIIDSGTTVTALEERAFIMVTRAFMSRIKLPQASGASLGLSLCFTLPDSGMKSVDIPKLIFHFDGADLDMPLENYIVEDTSNRLLCLGMVSTRGISILGNMQQQNMNILYDMEKGLLSFEPAVCSKL
ncbi:Eukaryotic aspartyl protease family protein [Rhynchospora pubera]|uniref:nepenthesin n=1 Tax=Rhynchospora pubera TaxID=906938 RepID=A0AAV8G711_9POAL|nr:Eukaryotic aspartyl protease family protein [Rhynchospora pubera]